MLRITPIKCTTQRNGRFQGIRWVAGNVSLLLLLTAGLQLFAHQTLRHSSAATIILALVLATWSYVLGLGLVLFLSVGWLIEWLHKGSADALVTMGERVQKVAWGGSIFPMVPGHLPAFTKDRMSISRVLVRQIGRTRGGWSSLAPACFQTRTGCRQT